MANSDCWILVRVMDESLSVSLLYSSIMLSIRLMLMNGVPAAAKCGFQADGVELNTWLVQYSRLSALTHGVFNRTKFFQKDLWKYDVSPYNYIVIFGVEQMVEYAKISPIFVETLKIFSFRFGSFADARLGEETAQRNRCWVENYSVSFSIAQFTGR